MPRITFIGHQEVIVEAEPGMSILEAAEHNGARVGSACGGNLACSTCHVWVQKGFDSLSEIEEEEDDILDKAFDVREESRLACQACVDGEDLIVEITPESLQAWLDEHPDSRG